MFFNDVKLRDRTMQITGRLFKDTHLLQALDVRSVIKGQLHEVYYWCDICSIRRRQKQICDCCGGPLELKEVPVKK
jgi:rRNA maturation endonuclease Nob1